MPDKGKGKVKTGVNVSASDELGLTQAPQAAQSSSGNGMVSNRTILIVKGVWARVKKTWMKIWNVCSSWSWTTILQVISSTMIAFVSIVALFMGHKNAILDQRAWVNVTSVQNPVRNANNANTLVGKVQVNIKNTGKTPAFQVKMTAFVNQTKDRNLPNLKSELEDKKEYLDGVRIIMPGPESGYQPVWANNSKRKGRVFIDQSILDEIKSGQAIFVYGRIDYDDVSGAPHWTTYCQQLDDREIWVACEKYNETDDIGWRRWPW